jgi:hypothetical protein
MLTKDELAKKVLDAVKGNPEAIKEVSGALVSRDPERIHEVFLRVAKIDLGPEEIDMILRELGSSSEQAVAYVT